MGNQNTTNPQYSQFYLNQTNKMTRNDAALTASLERCVRSHYEAETTCNIPKAAFWLFPQKREECLKARMQTFTDCMAFGHELFGEE